MMDVGLQWNDKKCMYSGSCREDVSLKIQRE